MLLYIYIILHIYIYCIYKIMLYILYYIISYHIILYYIWLYYVYIIFYSIILLYIIIYYIILYYIMLYYIILYLLYILYYIYIDYVYVCIYRPKNFDNILKQMMVNKLYKSIQNKWKGSLTNWNGRKRWFFRNRKGMKRDLNKQIWGQHWFWAIKVTNIAMNINKYIYIL